MNPNYPGARIILEVCTQAQREESLLFISDDSSQDIAAIMWEASADFPNRVAIRMSDRKMHGDEPPAEVAAAMEKADVIISTTKFSMFHTNARRNSAKYGARFVNMADYVPEMFQHGGLFVDFAAQEALLDRIAERFVGEDICITSAAGTEIHAKMGGRLPSHQYGRSIVKGAVSAPPNIETAVGPIEDTAWGTVVIDGSIPFPGLGVLRHPITLRLEKGRIVEISGGTEAEKLREVLTSLHDDQVYRLGEIGIGLNNMAVLCNRMLEDEGCMGTVHFGFGSNTSFGGNIVSNNHLDMVFRDPTLMVDGTTILKDGISTV